MFQELLWCFTGPGGFRLVKEGTWWTALSAAQTCVPSSESGLMSKPQPRYAHSARQCCKLEDLGEGFCNLPHPAATVGSKMSLVVSGSDLHFEISTGAVMSLLIKPRLASSRLIRTFSRWSIFLFPNSLDPGMVSVCKILLLSFIGPKTMETSAGQIP